MTAKKRDIPDGPSRKDGKKGSAAATRSLKKTAKYTIVRSKEDIAFINKVRKYLEVNHSNNSYKADSKIYKELPGFFLNAVKEIDQLHRRIDELTAKQVQLVELRDCFCRISEICKKEN